jgi:hypothetical protein
MQTLTFRCPACGREWEAARLEPASRTDFESVLDVHPLPLKATLADNATLAEEDERKLRA